MLGDFLQRGFDRAGDVESRALGRRSCAPISPAETDCTSELAQEKINLVLDPSGAVLVATFAQILQLLSELDDSALVFLFGLGVEHLARVAESADADGSASEQRSLVRALEIGGGARAGAAQEIKRMEFFTGMLKQTLNVAEALDVLQRETGVAVADGPVLAAADEYSRLPDGYWLRPGMASTLG